MTNNKQQTAMKLYTEEQVLEIIANINRDVHVSSQELLEGIEVKPIELPSDDEINEMGIDVIIYNDTKRGWFVEGLKYMRDKIQGGQQ
jgi:hypothetical protein